MPRKALVTARAAIRFAHQAADERGGTRHHRRGRDLRANGGVLLGCWHIVPRTNSYKIVLL